MKEKLTTALGATGVIVWYVISAIYCIAPLLILEFPFWVDIILIFIMLSLPFLGEVVRLVLFVWAFIVAIGQPIDAVTIIFFICTAIYVFTTLIPFIGALFSKNR